MSTRRVFSAKVNDHLWIAANREEMVRMRREGNKEVIYLAEEIKMLQQLKQDSSFIAVHCLKRHFPNPLIVEITPAT